MSISDLTKAIENGARGVYGRTYKMCVQEVLIWVRKYQESASNYTTQYGGRAVPL